MSTQNHIDESWHEPVIAPTQEDEHVNGTLGMDVELNPLLENIPTAIIKQAWFIMAHLVLERGSKVINMMARDGTMTYAMAVMNPDIEFIGIDNSEKHIDQAKEKYDHPNLRFVNKDIQESFIPPSCHPRMSTP